ncbi:MAG: hypothetical protein PHN31_01040 [Candidatus Gracilibacteria bacterium]|nr:hypothetical protein [Candidatus Gracilibacteria bacterium]
MGENDNKIIDENNNQINPNANNGVNTEVGVNINNIKDGLTETLGGEVPHIGIQPENIKTDSFVSDATSTIINNNGVTPEQNQNLKVESSDPYDLPGISVPPKQKIGPRLDIDSEIDIKDGVTSAIVNNIKNTDLLDEKLPEVLPTNEPNIGEKPKEDNLVTEELSHVLPAEKVGSTGVDNSSDDKNHYSKRLIGLVYLVIFVSIMIGLYFYYSQNKKTDENEKTLSGQIIDGTGLNNMDGDTVDESLDSKGVIDESGDTTTPLTDKNETGGNTETKVSSGDSSKSEEAIINDFEDELDSLFDMIDKNDK